MRLDRFLSESNIGTRREISAMAKAGRICVNGKVMRDASVHIRIDRDEVKLDGKPVIYTPFVYIMLRKPKGYVSATEDSTLPPVTDLLSDELRRRGLFPCGRLDRDTAGLMLLTDDGALAHDLLSPRHHVTKTYRFCCADELCAEAEDAFAHGMTLGNGDELKAAQLFCDSGRRSGTVLLTEGKYHQVKRMFGALNNKITELERISFGPLLLDMALSEGEYRYLTDAETAALHLAAKK